MWSAYDLRFNQIGSCSSAQAGTLSAINDQSVAFGVAVFDEHIWRS